MDTEPEEIEDKYHLSVNNLTNKQPTIVNSLNTQILLKSIIFSFFQYNSFDVSKNLIVYGSLSTGSLFIYRRNPFQFYQAVPGNIIRGK